jgi:quercetin dioxygenase-like cupin family protein
MSAVLRPGDLTYRPPLTKHAIRFTEDSEILALTTVARDNGGYETDTVRLDVPLRVSGSG